MSLSVENTLKFESLECILVVINHVSNHFTFKKLSLAILLDLKMQSLKYLLNLILEY